MTSASKLLSVIWVRLPAIGGLLGRLPLTIQNEGTVSGGQRIGFGPATVGRPPRDFPGMLGHTRTTLGVRFLARRRIADREAQMEASQLNGSSDQIPPGWLRRTRRRAGHGAFAGDFYAMGRNALRFLRVLTPMPVTDDQDIESTRRDLGRGVYGLRELRVFLAVSGAPSDGDRALVWLRTALNPVDHHARRADYSFSDLISLFVVRELLRRGVQPRAIRGAEDYLRRKWKTDRPFLSELIQTDGKRVFVDGEPVPAGEDVDTDTMLPEQLEAADLRGQQVLREPIRQGLAYVQYDDGFAHAWSPAEGIRVDPRIQFGDPVIAGTRVPTEAVAALATRRGLEAAASDLAISVDAARTAVAFEKKLAGALP